MQIRILILSFLICCLQPAVLLAQLESSQGQVSGYRIDSWYDISIDSAILETLTAITPSKDGALQFAFPVAVSLNPGNSGFIRDNGKEKIWTVGIRSKGAKSLNLILEPFRLCEGAYVYVYDSGRSMIRGAFGKENNNKSGILALMPVPGDEIILEYHVPGGVISCDEVGISQVAHDYLGIFGTEIKDDRFNTSQSCNRDINCSEGLDYQTEKRSVCRMIINGIELCSGFLINNTNLQNRPFLVTAQHCIEDNYDASRAVFVFGYESNWCFGPDGRVIHSLSGAEMLSSNPEIDFSLVELHSMPPVTYKPYFAGWDVSGITPQKTSTIHHPMGDVMKISLDSDAPVTSTFPGYAANGFWKILFWNTGTTEGGSSGAPLFDQNKRVIGLLSGGLAVCGNSRDDYFAKLSVIYDISPFLWEQLKGWIDPAGTGLKKFDGRDPYSANMLTVDTLSNIGLSETLLTTEYPVAGNGYTTGHNSDSLVMYAEYFTNVSGKEIAEVIIHLAKVNYSSSMDSVRVFVFSDEALPGNVISSQKVFMVEASDNSRLKVDFVNPVIVPGNFYIGWKIYYRKRANDETNQFAVFHSQQKASPDLNSAWFSDGNSWKEFTEHSNSPMPVALDVKVVVIGNSVPNKAEETSKEPFKFTVYPIPADNILALKSFDNLMQIRYELFDVRGVRIRAKRMDGLFPGEERIDVSGLGNGLYYLVIKSAGYSELHKIIIAR